MPLVRARARARNSVAASKLPGARGADNRLVAAAPQPARARGAMRLLRGVRAGRARGASGLHYVARAASRSDVLIEQVRELIARLGARRSRGARRVAIIDDAETLNLPAQNALLKTLEEPPGHTIIFLVAEQRARAARYRALAPAAGALRAARRRAKSRRSLSARTGSDAERAQALARLARGSAGARARAGAAATSRRSRELIERARRRATLWISPGRRRWRRNFSPAAIRRPRTSS